jgi:hypothetical protein
VVSPAKNQIDRQIAKREEKQWKSEVPQGIMPYTNYQGREKRAALPPSPSAASGDGITDDLPSSFRPAGRGRRSAASLPTAKFVKGIIAAPHTFFP